MRRKAAWLLLLLAPAASLAACLAVDTDGLSAGDEQTPNASVIDVEGGVVYVQADSAAAVVDATLPDETPDAGFDADAEAAIEDAGQIDSSSDADAAPMIDAASTPFCPGDAGHSICTDFDENSVSFNYTTDGLHWVDEAFGGGTTRLDSDASTSPPDSFLGAVVFVDGGGSQGGAIHRDSLPTTTKAIHLEMDVMPAFSAPIAFGQITLFNLFEVVPPSGYYGTSFGAYTGGYFFDNNLQTADGGTAGTFLDLASLPPNVWTHVIIVVTRLPAGHITIAYGNAAPLLDEALNVVSTKASQLDLVVGMNANGVFPTSAAHFDNVTVDITP